MVSRLAVDVGCTTVVAAAQEAAGGPARMLGFEGEDGPAGTLAASVTWSAGGVTRVGIEADRALDADPHRGVRGPLAHLESGSSTLELGPGPLPVVALVAELLTRPLRVATRELGGPPEQTVLSIPSGWAPDGRRSRALLAAAALAGLAPVTLVASAVAAAELARDDDAEVVLVCDVGGRTGQLSLVDLRDGPGRLLATTELVAGADLFDELLYHELVGELAATRPDAARQLEELHLQTGAAQAGGEAARWAACQAELARAVRHCREALTTAGAREVAVGEPVGVSLGLSAERARDLLAADCQILAAAAREQLAQARTAGAGTRAVLVGGGALTPGLRETLEAELGCAVAVDEDPATAVARGALAVAAGLPAAGRPSVGAPAIAAGPPAAGRPSVAAPGAAPSRPPASPRAPRTVLEDVVAATLGGGEVVAVVRHDAHHRVVRIDAQGRVGAAQSVRGRDVTALAATPATVVVASTAGAAILSADLRPLTAIERPLIATASGTSVWVVAAGEGDAPVLALTTLAIEGRRARVAEVSRIGLAAPPAAARPARRTGRPASPAPPAPHAVAAAGRLHFAVPVRGRGGAAAQRVGHAGPAGIGSAETRIGPLWVIGQAPAASGVLMLEGSGPTALALGDRRLAGWPAGVRVELAAHPPQSPWIVAARRDGWEALRLHGDAIVAVRGGDGAVESVRADGEDGLWLVCESGGERRLVRLGPDGELVRLAALGAPLEPVGRAGAEVLVLAGPRDAPRTLVAVAPG